MATKVSFILFFFLFSSASLADLSSGNTPFKLKRTSDGDTIVALDDTRIRLWGIDTPERDQPYGNKAKKALESMLRRETLYLEIKNVDRYGRTVGVIFTADGDDVNLEMVCNGYAWWYERYAKEATDYKQCQKDAQKNKRGLWAQDDPIAPWNWRRQ